MGQKASVPSPGVKLQVIGAGMCFEIWFPISIFWLRDCSTVFQRYCGLLEVTSVAIRFDSKHIEFSKLNKAHRLMQDSPEQARHPSVEPSKSCLTGLCTTEERKQLLGRRSTSNHGSRYFHTGLLNLRQTKLWFSGTQPNNLMDSLL